MVSERKKSRLKAEVLLQQRAVLFDCSGGSLHLKTQPCDIVKCIDMIVRVFFFRRTANDDVILRVYAVVG